MFKKLQKLFIKENNEENTKKKVLPQSFDEKYTFFKDLFRTQINQDVIFRKFTINTINKRAFIIFIDTISDAQNIEYNILKPLLNNTKQSADLTNIITGKQIKKISSVKDISNEIALGNTAIFIEDDDLCYIVNSEKFEGRPIEKAETEVTLKGPKDSFTDQLSLNINLIRKKVRNPNLVNETKIVGQRSLDSVSILYLADIIDDNILKELKERLDNIDSGHIQNVSVLLQYIQDNRHSVFPTILETERPDRASTFIENGHIILAMENSDTVLILPVSFWNFIQMPDDDYLHPIYGNFLRIIRTISIFVTLFTSALYVAVTNFHTEMVPPDLLLAIAATREKVPFPAIVEVLLMEFAFELIREAGLRVPNPVGPTIGIVGALILGQAASEANIVSPIVIIVVALSGLSSFLVNNIMMNFSFRFSRFIFILAAGMFGFFGIVTVFMIGFFYIVSIKSFGVSYFAPYRPHYKGTTGTLLRRFVKKDQFRTPFVKPKDVRKQGEFYD